MVQLLLPIIYISFISLGLPDSLLGSAWPSMYPALGVPVSYAGLISMIISFGTIVSSLNSDRLTRALGTGKVTALSVGMTAAALFGFSVSTQFWMLCLWAVPYGLGAGSVDAALNNYVALHYKSGHMSWLHCMWGIGTMVSPMVMGRVLAGGGPWTSGYRCIALFQILLSAVLFFSLPLWQSRTAGTDAEAASPQVLSLGQVFRLPGAREVMLCFFCYCALEQTTGLWASSYLTLCRGVSPETAAKCRRCGKHDTFAPLPGVTVETFPSTDEGVAWMVTVNGQSIFHAGDLNWWHWAEEDLAWNRNMEANFKRYAEPLRGRRVDLAMLPLDSRLKTGGYLGPNYFLNLMEVRRFLPMHQWEDFDFTDEFLSAYPQFAPITVKIHRDGEFLGEL